MEEIYLKGFDGPREWCTENVNLKSYFDEYSKALNNAGLTEKKVSAFDILEKLVPESTLLSKDELNKLDELTDPAQLMNFMEEDFKKKLKIKSAPGPSTSANEISPKSLNGPKKQINRLKNRTSLKRTEVPEDHSQMGGPKDLVPYKHYLVSFRVHEPSHNARPNSGPSRCMQQIELLGHQPLVALRDKIICEWDYQDLAGDISENPGTRVKRMTKDEYPSSMFYLGNTFYIDRRMRDSQDYSKTVKDWGKKKGLKFNYETRLMEESSVYDLTLRFGYPYLFLHQGLCEHLVVISDARLLLKRDSLCSADYPLVSQTTKQKVIYCLTCARFPAKWIVTESHRLAHDPSYMCTSCFKMFNYVKGKKDGTFKAFRYKQRAFVDVKP